MTPEEAFGRTLATWRRKRGLSQEQLAAESGYHRTYISLLERGLRSPSLTTIFYLAKILKVKPSELISEVERVDGVINVRAENVRAFGEDNEAAALLSKQFA